MSSKIQLKNNRIIMLRVLFLTQYDQNGPSSRVRVYQFLDQFKKMGVDYTVRPLLTGQVKELVSTLFSSKNIGIKMLTAFKIAASFLKRYGHVISAVKFDLVVVQKDVLPFGLLPILKICNKNIIYEFDDAIWEPTPGAKKNSSILKLVFAYRKRLFHNIVRASKAILAENTYLAAYASRFNKKVTVIAAPIDTQKYFPSSAKSENKDQIVLGWIGSPSTSYLLESLEEPLVALSKKYKNLVVHNIGGLPLRMPEVKIKNIKWSEEHEVEELAKFDIGLMPLDDTDFNKGRLGYKMIIYFSMGLPTVASDIGLNKKVIQPNKNGMLVKGNDDWVKALQELIEKPKLRQQFGKLARQIAVRDFDIKICAKKYIELMAEVAKKSD